LSVILRPIVSTDIKMKTAVVLMALVVLVSAKPGQERDNQLLEQGARILDANGDGYISHNEFPGNLPSNVWRSTMAMLDKNRDGRLSVAEYLESAKQQLSKPGADFDSQIEAGLAYLDTNSDGFLSRSEVPGNVDSSQWSQMMRVADKNHDGKLSFKEFHDLSNQVRQDGAGGGAGGGTGGSSCLSMSLSMMSLVTAILMFWR